MYIIHDKTVIFFLGKYLYFLDFNSKNIRQTHTRNDSRILRYKSSVSFLNCLQISDLSRVYVSYKYSITQHQKEKKCVSESHSYLSDEAHVCAFFTCSLSLTTVPPTYTTPLLRVSFAKSVSIYRPHHPLRGGARHSLSPANNPLLSLVFGETCVSVVQARTARLVGGIWWIISRRLLCRRNLPLTYLFAHL